MQQPLPVPDEYDDEGEPLAGPPTPPPTVDGIAEQSALEVFPGAAELDSDQWWQPPEPVDDDGVATEPPPLPTRMPEPPSAERSRFALTDDLGEPEFSPVESPEPANTAPKQLWSTPEPEPLPQPAHEPVVPIDLTPADLAPIDYGPVERAPIDAAAPAVTEVPETVTPEPPSALDYSSDIPRSVLSLPLRPGREQREAAGASQREAIMAQAGAAPEAIAEGAASNAEAQLAVAMGGGAAAAPSAPASGGWFSRRIRLSLIVIALTLTTLWGGAIATGQGGDVERGASALAPDVVERWIADQWSSFGGSDAPPAVDTPIGEPDRPVDQALFGQIAHTGGGGVPVRSTCVVEARTPRVINEGAPVTVIARGVGDCSGWSVVRAGATVSWVEAAYIEAGPTP